MKNKIIIKAFTLVELIVVITILSVLATIGFISFQGYGVSSRDTVRLTDMKIIEKALAVKRDKGELLPLPDKSVEILASGSTLSYQGEASVQVLGELGVNGGGVDPIDNSYYTYIVNAERNQSQLLGFFEKNNEGTLIENTLEKYPLILGQDLGVLIDSSTEQSIHVDESYDEIDIVTTTSDYLLLTSSSEPAITGNGGILSKKLGYRIYERGSCEALLKNGYSQGNGLYSISPEGGDTFDVFCDMNNGGYTGLFSVDPEGTTWAYNSSEWINPTLRGDLFFTEETTYQSYESLPTLDIRMCRGNMNSCYTMKHNKGIPLHQFYRDSISYVDFSRFKVSSDERYNTNGPENIGDDKKELFFDSLDVNYTLSNSFNKYGVGINIHDRNKIGFQSDNNNAWPNFDNRGLGIGVARYYDCGYSSEGNQISVRARSIGTINTCAYLTPDTEKWFILGK